MYKTNSREVPVSKGCNFEFNNNWWSNALGFIGSWEIEPFEGESNGYSVKTLEEEFPISNYPLEQTEFLYYMKEGMFTKICDFIRSGDF